MEQNVSNSPFLPPEEESKVKWAVAASKAFFGFGEREKGRLICFSNSGWATELPEFFFQVFFFMAEYFTTKILRTEGDKKDFTHFSHPNRCGKRDKIELPIPWERKEGGEGVNWSFWRGRSCNKNFAQKMGEFALSLRTDASDSDRDQRREGRKEGSRKIWVIKSRTHFFPRIWQIDVLVPYILQDVPNL